MELKGASVLLTGASGGIGRALAKELALRGARLGLVGRNATSLQDVIDIVRCAGSETVSIVADIGTTDGRHVAVQAMGKSFNGTDILINNAGVTAFADFSTQDEAEIECIVRTNLLAPMTLTRSILSTMQIAGRGKIVNIGSTFGSIGFAWFASYSASKFGLRGFSEALRRELAGSGIDVLYAAPRAVKTALNTEAVNRMAEHVKMNMDEPAWVAGKIVTALANDKKDIYIGFPESLFARINSVLPRLIDRALHKQNKDSKKFISS